MSYHLRDLGSKRCIDPVVLQRSFLSVDTVNPHPPRRRPILKAHPEVETLVGPDPRTVVITLAVVIGQTLVAALFGLLGLTYWWLALIAAFCIGAFAITPCSLSFTMPYTIASSNARFGIIGRDSR